jgi:hypothetical protein
MKLLVPALAIGIASLYFISRHRKLELDVEMKMEPKKDTLDQPLYEEEH